jgi:general secretion pathway protein D
VKQYVDVGNIQQPIIGQNKSTADLRLREGEVNILAGLTRQQESDLTTGIPGLTDIPVLGKFFFGDNRKEQDRGEMMIALVPHIVRSPDYTSENVRGVLSGTDAVLKLNVGKPEDLGTPAAPNAAPGTPQAAAAKPAEGTRIAFDPNPITANANAPFNVNIVVENATDTTAAAPLRITWNPQLMRLNSMSAGDLLSRGGGQVSSVPEILNNQGTATLTLTRPAGSTGVNGTGTLATLTFVALAPGSDRITVTELGLRNSQNVVVPVAGGNVPVTIR